MSRNGVGNLHLIDGLMTKDALFRYFKSEFEKLSEKFEASNQVYISMQR